MQQYSFPRQISSFFPTIGTVFIYMTCHVLCYMNLAPAHCRVAWWEDGRIGREVFKLVEQIGQPLFGFFARNVVRAWSCRIVRHPGSFCCFITLDAFFFYSSSSGAYGRMLCYIIWKYQFCLSFSTDGLGQPDPVLWNFTETVRARDINAKWQQ